MKEPVRNLLISSLLLYALFAVVYYSIEGPRPKLKRYAGPPRLLVSDSVLYGFVRELLAQSDTVMVDTVQQPTTFYISKVLLENDLLPGYKLRERRYQIRHAPSEQELGLEQLCSEGLLSSVDAAFMRQQIKFSVGFGLEQRKLPGYTVIPADTVWQLERLQHAYAPHFAAMQILRQRHHTSYFSWLSAPLFSCDGRTVIVATNMTCGGGLCGSGETWLLQRHHGKWRKVKLLSEWIS
ncbi:hypothetical protein DNI29_04620 [Hymenobacter sediminis]|uniref:hypothetical protein n=1 Tax=Hymenobacter sediminis TaxID=2218621 RepID=UPI000F514068|nr:hypothetical protein [Hymenobacter sediminis]RPD50085.1 hypothetical protein DNI29_04620 [Hymenobacter sediminis]